MSRPGPTVDVLLDLTVGQPPDELVSHHGLLVAHVSVAADLGALDGVAAHRGETCYGRQTFSRACHGLASECRA